MDKLIHITAYHDKEGQVKFRFTDWIIEKVVGDDFHVFIGGDPTYKSTAWRALIGTPNKERRLDITDQFGWIVVEEGKEEEGKAALIEAAKEANEETIRTLEARIAMFKKKGEHLDLYSPSVNA